ncbi:uncharacterized protein LOC131086316 [Melospiza georgiana]|uniref:uncharacterized protein LOC131086316 n=1 Tax=Melospiza georgiana TaxID=44398 RepID=UPI0025AC8E3F|nr:uncharacterized protein LOC131086316 [Melospiza georgiana]
MEALRRPALPEDAVRYRLFAAAAAAGPGGEALLRRCAELALVRLAPLLAACVWQRQPFRLRYVPGRGEPGAGREARREERPERGDWEEEPAAGNRERDLEAVILEHLKGNPGACEGDPAAGNRGHVRENRNRLKEPAAGNRELVRANRESVRDTWRPEPESFEGGPGGLEPGTSEGEPRPCEGLTAPRIGIFGGETGGRELTACEGDPAGSNRERVRGDPAASPTLGVTARVNPVRHLVPPPRCSGAIPGHRTQDSVSRVCDIRSEGDSAARVDNLLLGTALLSRLSSLCPVQARSRRTWAAPRCSGITWRMSGSLCSCCGRSAGSCRGWQPGDCHSVFVCTAGAAAVCSRQTQWIHPARPSSSSVQSLRAGHEAGNDSWGILALAHACAGNGSLSGSCLLVQRNVSKVCPTLRTSCCCIFCLQAHGFEMLCSKSSKVAPDAKRNVLRGPLWERFLRSLKEKDYFKGEMEGSAKYLELLHMAEDHFQQSVAVPESCDEVSPGDEILALLQTTPIDLKELEREAACLPAEDDDSWLDMTPGALDQMLKETRNESLPSPKEEEQNYDLETVAEGMKAFVSKVSTEEGAEMPWSSDESQVTFDVDCFTKALDRILGADSEELDSDDVDEEEEFGFSDEDDEELDAGNGRQEQKVSPEELVGSLKAYMEEMDRELAQTNVGKSFSSHKRGVSVPWALICSSNFQAGNVLQVAILSNGIETFPRASKVCWTCTIIHFL